MNDEIQPMEFADMIADLEGEAEVNSKDLKTLTETAAKYKAEIDAYEEAITKLKNLYNPVVEALQSTLELLDIKKISAQGYEFKIEAKSSVQTPKTEEEKKELFEYLKSIDLFYQIVSVNSSTLNSTYKNLAAQVMEETGALEFIMPGVGKPTIYTTLKVKKEK